MEIDPIEHLRYHRWATKLLLEGAAGLTAEQLHKELGTPYVSLFGTLVHIYQADRVWYTRLQGESPTAITGVTPEEGLAKLDPLWTETLDMFVQWAEGIGEWGSTLHYANAGRAAVLQSSGADSVARGESWDPASRARGGDVT